MTFIEPLPLIKIIHFLGGTQKGLPTTLVKKRKQKGFHRWVCIPYLCLAELRQWMDILAELGRGTQNDLLSVEGWLLAVRETLRLKRGRGLFFAGHPCHP